MRIRLTIDDDVAAELERLRRSRDVSLNEVVNHALRRGLRDMNEKPKKREPFRTRTFDCGMVYLPNVDNIAEVLAYLEGEDFK